MLLPTVFSLMLFSLFKVKIHGFKSFFMVCFCYFVPCTLLLYILYIRVTGQALDMRKTSLSFQQRENWKTNHDISPQYHDSGGVDCDFQHGSKFGGVQVRHVHNKTTMGKGGEVDQLYTVCRSAELTYHQYK